MRACCLILFALVLIGCGGPGNQTATQTNTPGSPAPTAQAMVQPTVQATPLTGFEKDMQFIRNGQFAYVWVFSRKDGKRLDKDDGAFLRTNAPQVVDWVQTDEGKKVIAGTNFNLEEGNLTALRKRFVVEDYTGR
jgi:hypothetical protein